MVVVDGEVLAGARVEEVDLRPVDPDLGLLALLDPAGAVERHDELGAQRLPVEVALELAQLLLDLGRRLERDVGVGLVAQPLDDVDLRPERRTGVLLGPHRCVLEVLRADAGDQQPLARRPSPPARAAARPCRTAASPRCPRPWRAGSSSAASR